VNGGNWPENRFPLPGGWLIGERPEQCRRYDSAVLRPLTGHEEEWLARHHGVPNAVRTSRLLNACVSSLDDEPPPRDVARNMLVGDRDYLILQLRRLTFGDRVLAVADCPGCGSKMDIDFDSAAIPIERGAPIAADYEIELSAEAGLPGRALRFRLPCGGDQEAVLGLDVETAADKLLERCVLSPAVAPLAADEKARVIAAIEARAPRVELELDLGCPECGHAFVMPFDTTAFFLDELRITAGQLLREVHFLAFYYHWTESQILDLGRDRRRTYLSLLSDTLRQD
jgi:hypothetical protein